MKIANSVDPFGAADIPDGNPLGPNRLAADGAPNAPVTDRMVEYQPPQWDPGESDKPPSPPGGNTSGKDPYSDEKYNSGLDSHKPVFSANQLKINLGKFHSADGAAGPAGQIGVELPSQGLRPPQTRLPDSSDLGETPGGEKFAQFGPARRKRWDHVKADVPGYDGVNHEGILQASTLKKHVQLQRSGPGRKEYEQAAGQPAEALISLLSTLRRSARSSTSPSRARAQ